MRKLISLLIAAAALQAAHAQTAGTFTQKPPGNLNPADVPMFICFGVDDNAHLDGIQWFSALLKARKNPPGKGQAATFDGAQAHATFYLTASFADPEGFVAAGSQTVSDVANAWKGLYQDGNEIGNHTWDHAHGTAFDLAAWKNEMSKTNDFLVKTIGLAPKEIRGFRTPFLEYNDATFGALKDLGFAFDCSIEFGYNGWQPVNGDTGWWNSMSDPNTYKKLFWPYTLDNGSPPGNASKGNPKVTGLWEIPVNTFLKPDNLGDITGFDFNLWNVMDANTFTATLKRNFDLRRQGNHAPLAINMHTDYYSQYDPDAERTFTLADWQHRRQAMQEFLDYALQFPETRVVTTSQMLGWMANPVSLGGVPASVPSPQALRAAALSVKLSPEGRLELDFPSAGRYDLTLATPAGKTLLHLRRTFSAGPARLDAGPQLPGGVYCLRVGDGARGVTRKVMLSR